MAEGSGLMPRNRLPMDLELRPNKGPSAIFRVLLEPCLCLSQFEDGLELGHWWMDARLPNETKGI